VTPRVPDAAPLLVAIDLDGTLLGPSLTLSRRVCDAVAAATQQGVATTIVTGRMFVATAPYAAALGIEGPLVCYQGAAVFDWPSGEKLREVPLTHDVALRVAARAKRDGYHVQLYHDDRFYVEERNKYSALYARLAGIEPVVVPSLAREFAGRDSTKCNIVTEPSLAAEYAQRMRDLCGDDAYVTRSNPEFIEVMDPCVDKGEALRFVAERLGVPMSRVLAIGDSYNDVPLLRAAGFSVAMGSSPDEVKATADAVVGDVAHDGVAEALETFVLSRVRAPLLGGTSP
jgi:Cof subfamily protein (haloacid dehalogenase superfamily)